jgi:putative peptidoglycan lipid II flippase
MLSSVVASGGLVVDQGMAAMLPAGSVSALAYGGRFVSVALALLGGSVASAVAPFFSEMVAHGEWKECRKALRTWAWWSVGLGALVAAALASGAHSLVRITFQHGRFGPQDTSVVASVLTMSALQIPFFVCSRVFYRFLIAMRRTDLVFHCGLINLGIDVVLNLIFMHWMGVAGIALSTSVWSASTLMFLGYWAWRVLPPETADRQNLCG